MALDITEHGNGLAVIDLRRSPTTPDYWETRDYIAELVRRAPKVIVSCAGLSHIEHAIVASMLHSVKAARERGGGFHLFHLRLIARRPFECKILCHGTSPARTSLAGYFSFYQCEQDAIRAFETAVPSFPMRPWQLQAEPHGDDVLHLVLEGKWRNDADLDVFLEWMSRLIEGHRGVVVVEARDFTYCKGTLLDRMADLVQSSQVQAFRVAVPRNRLGPAYAQLRDHFDCWPSVEEAVAGLPVSPPTLPPADTSEG